jgi:hypothetical protein
VLSNVAVHTALPSADKRYGVNGIQMSTKRGLIRPTFQYEQSSGLRIIHCSVIGDVSGALSRGDSKNSQITKKLRQVRGVYVDVSGYKEHDAFLVKFAPDQ